MTQIEAILTDPDTVLFKSIPVFIRYASEAIPRLETIGERDIAHMLEQMLGIATKWDICECNPSLALSVPPDGKIQMHFFHDERCEAAADIGPGEYALKDTVTLTKTPNQQVH